MATIHDKAKLALNELEQTFIEKCAVNNPDHADYDYFLECGNLLGLDEGDGCVKFIYHLKNSEFPFDGFVIHAYKKQNCDSFSHGLIKYRTLIDGLAATISLSKEKCAVLRELFADWNVSGALHDSILC